MAGFYCLMKEEAEEETGAKQEVEVGSGHGRTPVNFQGCRHPFLALGNPAGFSVLPDLPGISFSLVKAIFFPVGHKTWLGYSLGDRLWATLGYSQSLGR